jgi:uncharacterized iron-regulated membrane protein
VIADQQNKLNKLFSSLRSIKKIVKKTKRQSRRKLAEQNAKIDTLISLLASNGMPNSSTNLSPVSKANEKENVGKGKGKNAPATPTSRSNSADKDSNVLGKHNSPNPEHKQILPLITVSGPTDMELSPYSLG